MKELAYIGLGTAAIGRPQYINIRQETVENQSLEKFKQEGKKLLQLAYDLGVRYFDTAPGYGMAEALIMSWLNETDISLPEIASKWGYTYTANFDPNAKIHELKEHSVDKLNEQWEVTKTLLPALKYYQIHSATFETQVLNNNLVLNRLASLKEKYGIIIGLTTTGENHVEVFQEAIKIQYNGKPLFDLFQVTYNVFDQSFGITTDNINNTNIKIVVKEALANGRVFPNQKFRNYQKIYKTLEILAEKYAVGIDAIALRFCIDSLPIFKVLSGASTSNQLISNLKTANFKLETKDIELLKSFAVNPKSYWNERKQLIWN